MQLMLLVVISLSHYSLASGASAATATSAATASAARRLAPAETATALRMAMGPGHKEEDPFPKWLIELGSHASEADTAILSTRKPRVTGKVRGGTFCLNTEECGIGKCCLRRSKDPRRVCKRFQRIGERCTDDQMMGGYYYGYCPCNKRAVCTVVGHVLKCVKKPPLTPLPKPGTPPGTTTPPPEEKESKESEEIPQRPAPPPKNPGLNQTKIEFPEIPEFFKNFGTSDDTGPQFPIGGAGQEGGEQGGEEGEEEEQVPGHTGEDLPEDIIPQKESTGTPPEEPPEESSENELPKETTPTSAVSGGGGGNAIPPLLPKPGFSHGSGGPGVRHPTSTVSAGGSGNEIIPPPRPSGNSILPLSRSRGSPVATGLPGEGDIPALPLPPV